MRARPATLEDVGETLVARLEELLAMKVLSMTGRRPRDAGSTMARSSRPSLVYFIGIGS